MKRILFAVAVFCLVIVGCMANAKTENSAVSKKSPCIEAMKHYTGYYGYDDVVPLQEVEQACGKAKSAQVERCQDVKNSYYFSSHSEPLTAEQELHDACDELESEMSPGTRRLMVKRPPSGSVCHPESTPRPMGLRDIPTRWTSPPRTSTGTL